MQECGRGSVGPETSNGGIAVLSLYQTATGLCGTHVGACYWEELTRLKDYQVWFTNGWKMDTCAGAGAHRQGNSASVSVPLGRWTVVYISTVYSWMVMIIYKFDRIVGLPLWLWEPPSWSVSDRGWWDSLTSMDVLSLLVHRYVGLRRNGIAIQRIQNEIRCREDKCKSGANH